MSEYKHTPGPWLYDPDNDRYSLTIRSHSAQGHVVATIADNRNFTLSECEANAKLVAAAPQMLDALLIANKQLKEIIPCIDDGASDKINDILTTINDIESIITKATIPTK